jgi:hypothetical protein
MSLDEIIFPLYTTKVSSAGDSTIFIPVSVHVKSPAVSTLLNY